MITSRLRYSATPIVAAAILAWWPAIAGAAGAAGAPSTMASSTSSPCAVTSSSPVLLLRDTSPVPALRVAVGERFVVLVPGAGSRETTLRVTPSVYVTPLCSVGLANGARRTVFEALLDGRSQISVPSAGASSPATPAFEGWVTVVANQREIS